MDEDLLPILEKLDIVIELLEKMANPIIISNEFVEPNETPNNPNCAPMCSEGEVLLNK